MKAEKVEIKLAEVKYGYQLQGNALITIEASTVRIYKVIQRLTYHDHMDLERSFESAINSLLKRKKLREGGPLNIVNGEVYIDDMLVLRVGEDSVSVSIIM